MLTSTKIRFCEIKKDENLYESVRFFDQEFR